MHVISLTIIKFSSKHHQHWFLSVLAVEVTLKFTYVEKYPDEPPLWEIFSQENLEDQDTEDILTLLKQQVCTPDIIPSKNTFTVDKVHMMMAVL